MHKVLELEEVLLQQRQPSLVEALHGGVHRPLHQGHQGPEGVLLVHVQQQQPRNEPHTLNIPHLRSSRAVVMSEAAELVNVCSYCHEPHTLHIPHLHSSRAVVMSQAAELVNVCSYCHEPHTLYIPHLRSSVTIVTSQAVQNQSRSAAPQ